LELKDGSNCIPVDCSYDIMFLIGEND